MAQDTKRALFVSYNAVTEPIVRSQVMPYISALSSKGVEFTLLTFEKDATPAREAADALKKSGVEWRRLRFHSRPLFLAKPFDIAAGFFAVLGICLKKKIGIVHGRGVMAAVMTILPAKISGASFVFDMKSSLAEAYRLNGRLGKRSFGYRLLSWLERACVRGSDEVVVETNVHKALLEKMLDNRKRRPRITVLPCCVEVERFAAGQKWAPGSLRLVYLGSLSGWYMIPQMLDFFRAVKKRVKDAEFLFIADDKDGLVGRLAKEKELGDVTTRAVSYEDVPSHISAGCAGVLFKWPNERLDSFPIKVGEYLAAGLPLVINAGMGDVEDLVRESGLGVIVRSCDEAGYARAAEDLEKVLRDIPGIRERCAATARRYLSLSSGIERYSDIYRNVKI